MKIYKKKSIRLSSYPYDSTFRMPAILRLSVPWDRDRGGNDPRRKARRVSRSRVVPARRKKKKEKKIAKPARRQERIPFRVSEED